MVSCVKVLLFYVITMRIMECKIIRFLFISMTDADSHLAPIRKPVWKGIICDNVLFRNNTLWIAIYAA